MKAGQPSVRRRRWPTEGDRNRGGAGLVRVRGTATATSGDRAAM